MPTAPSSTTTSSAIRPEGKESVTVRSQSGALIGRTLLIKRLSFCAVDNPLENNWTIANSG